ncbi:MAG TPA: fumarylacetoacetate hydrolase family protein, partial [Acidobacteriaceae bacterium]|nr:fumarylacetoacetate hydrolase family protein [Acidobacteriaceae bacterium]
MTENRKRCWVESANDPETDFPIENLPFGKFDRRVGPDQVSTGLGLAIGDKILDLHASSEAGLFGDFKVPRFALHFLAGPGDYPRAMAIRHRATELLGDIDYRQRVESNLIPQNSVQMLPPFPIGDYTDFYASIHHATNVGKLFRPDNPLLPNYKWVPIGYHGRASSIVVSGTEIRRPWGQTKGPDAAEPTFTPSRMLDYELEMGFFVGEWNQLGATIQIEQAEEFIFGFCLVNDWSARDIQSWEYQPLGPFLSKSFATTISPWVVTLDALEPYRVPVARRPEGDPKPLPYLYSDADQRRGAFDVT